MTDLSAYRDVLKRLGSGRPGKSLPFLSRLPGIENLHRTMAAVAPTKPGDPAEEWNPLSQRPHAPVPPEVSNELGSEITDLKEAVDAFTTLCHEMLHVALWEPFFSGRWRPKSKAEFTEFALRGEGYCFFFSDIVLTQAVRVKLPDGEFALERQTPSSATFAPVRAFHALGIEDPEEILDVYLDAFNGEKTGLWQKKGKSDHASALAARTYDFYSQSLGYLSEFHDALASFGVFGEFFERFCAKKTVPAFWDEAPGKNPADYFRRFHAKGIDALAHMDKRKIAAIRGRRSIQMRAYFALQVRHLLVEGLTFGKKVAAAKVGTGVARYLERLEGLIGEAPKANSLTALDQEYDEAVRAPLARADQWVGDRWLILPRRAGGRINLFAAEQKGRHGQAVRLVTLAYVVDELTRRMKASRTVEERTALLSEIQVVAGLATKRTKLAGALSRPLVRDSWSLPLAAVDPKRNSFRELVLSYQ